MTSIINTVKNGSIALAVILFVAMPLAAHAADYSDTEDYFVPSDSGYTQDYFVPSDSGYTEDYFVPSYDDYGSGYGSSGYMGSGYLGGSYLGGGGGSYLPTSGGNFQTQSQAQSQAQSSNNTNVNNNIITITQPTPAPTPAPACNTCSCDSSYCYHPYNPPIVYQNPPIAYNQTPYVSLSAVPYTGLDLGFWGTIAYWGFLILWCLVAAYLVVVKKVQNRIFRALNSFLFGNSVSTSHEVATAAPVAVRTYSAPAVTTQGDVIDEFILSQVNRPRRA